MKEVLAKISNRIISIEETLINAMKKMDKEGVKMLLVFENERFLGILTVGDIQRAIIKNIDMNATIFSIFDKNKVYAKTSDSVEVIRKKMYDMRAELMPLVDENGELLDVYLWNEMFDSNKEKRVDKIDVPVVIMAGGLGTRLKPITNIIPKPLIPINDKTILETIIDQFEHIGCARYYISVNYKSEIIEYYFANLDKKYNITFLKEDKPLGTIGSVSLLKGKIDKPFFVSNCDIIVDQDYRDVYDYHRNNKNDITIVTAIKSFHIPYGVIETGENGLMKGISEKPDLSYMINTGVYILEPQLIDEIPENTFYHITDLIEKVRKNGGRVGCFPVSEKSWTDIGDWNEYLKTIKL
ncbi:MAG: nucleotidyltransferase family protein [Bacteroidales bacterium]|nr:nucleotidyltransferase family protein [Bacteroidales bacterium]